LLAMLAKIKNWFIWRRSEDDQVKLQIDFG
jgi:hypothetical protein